MPYVCSPTLVLFNDASANHAYRLAPLLTPPPPPIPPLLVYTPRSLGHLPSPFLCIQPKLRPYPPPPTHTHTDASTPPTAAPPTPPRTPMQAPIHYSNVMLVDPVTKRPVRSKFQFIEESDQVVKVRVSKGHYASKAIIPRPMAWKQDKEKEARGGLDRGVLVGGGGLGV